MIMIDKARDDLLEARVAFELAVASGDGSLIDATRPDLCNALAAFKAARNVGIGVCPSCWGSKTRPAPIPPGVDFECPDCGKIWRRMPR